MLNEFLNIIVSKYIHGFTISNTFSFFSFFVWDKRERERENYVCLIILFYPSPYFSIHDPVTKRLYSLVSLFLLVLFNFLLNQRFRFETF